MNLSTSSLSYDWFLFALRIAFIGLILLFLYQVARVTLGELVRIGVTAPSANTREALAASAVTPQLEIVTPAGSGLAPGEWFFVDPYTTIGRRADNAIVLAETSVSAMHAEIVYEGGQWWLRDLRSTNGTFVNGEQVTGQIRLESGDNVQFSNVAARFVA